MFSMQLNIALIGASGMLGQDVNTIFETAGHTVHGFSSSTLDITNAKSINHTLSKLQNLDYVINCAAYTKVDLAETERDLAFSINGDGVKNLAEFCKSTGIPLIHFSTDYVFNGQGDTPYLEDASTDPINAYGESKLAGESVLKESGCDFYLFRVQWLYGKHGKHFVDTISNLAQSRDKLTIIADQWGSPTWTMDIARMVLAVCAQKPEFGTYHFASTGYTNWADYARYFLDKQTIHCQISDIPTSAYPTPAKRPYNSRLNLGKIASLNTINLRSWQEQIDDFLTV